MTNFHDLHETSFNPNMQIIIVETLYNSPFSWIFKKFFMVLNRESQAGFLFQGETEFTKRSSLYDRSSLCAHEKLLTFM